MKKLLAVAVLGVALAGAIAPAVKAQNVNVTGENLGVNALGVGGASTGTPGTINFVGTGGTIGQVGDVSGLAASAGLVGESLQATLVAGSAVSETTATPVDITTLSLTPGDWQVTGKCDRTLTGTTATVYGCSLSGTLNTLSTQPGFATGNLTCQPETFFTQSATFGTTVTGRYDSVVGPIVCRVVTAAATIHLVAGDSFSAGTVGVFGSIQARRLR